MKRFCLPVILFIVPLVCLAALDMPTRQITDDSALRLDIRDGWLLDVPGRVLAKRSERRELAGGGRVEIRSETAGDEIRIVIARERPGSGGSFPGWVQGSWVLSRQLDNGEPVSLRVYLRSDRYTYVQFRPWTNEKCLMDVVLYEAYVVQSRPVPLSFTRLYEIPLEDILRLVPFPRQYFEPDPAAYAGLGRFLGTVRAALGGLNFRDDGAIDENGNYVFIKDGSPQEGERGLNCSGFAKWVIDGLLKPVTGKRLSIGPLKAPTEGRGSSFTEAFEELRDPFFGLDWTRNLAAAANATLRFPAAAALSEIEVREASFSELITGGIKARPVVPGSTSAAARDPARVPEAGSSLASSGRVPRPGPNAGISGRGERSYPGYLEGAGFGIEGLEPLLYTLAVDEPGYIYLASVNNELSGPPHKNQYLSLRLRQHFHVAVLVPYFNAQGEFKVAVLESAEETAFSRFRARYPSHFVNLVRVPASGRFMAD